MYFLVLQSEAGEYTVAGCNDHADPVLEARARSAYLVGVKATKGAALTFAAIARREGWETAVGRRRHSPEMCSTTFRQWDEERCSKT